MYPENSEGTQVIVGSMNMGYISDTARNRTHNLFRPKREPMPLGHSDGIEALRNSVNREREKEKMRNSYLKKPRREHLKDMEQLKQLKICENQRSLQV